MNGPVGGLEEAQAAEILGREGPNVLPAARRNTLPALVADVVREPMFGLLLGAGALYALIGDTAEALILLLFATISVSIAIVQRGRSERVLEALQDLTSPRALVIRSGVRRRIAGRDVVRGDVLVVAEGDRVAADAVLFDGVDVRVAEAMLTGESVPVLKQAERNAAGENPSARESATLYCGTLLVAGNGLARVIATGSHTQLGRLGATMREIQPEVPHLQAQTRRLVIGFAVVGGAVSIMVMLLHGLLRGDWIQALLGGIALGMAMLPEEFPLVLTVFMVMGAWRLSRSRVLTRRATAIESLGAATVLCTDKTGTLTQNAMAVVSLDAGQECWTGGPLPEMSAALARLLDTAALASDAQGHDPMDIALADLARRAGRKAAPLRPVRIYPLRRELLAVTHVWRIDGSPLLQIASKGAPESVARLCSLRADQREQLLMRVDRLARSGIRVLAVARGRLSEEQLPEEAGHLNLELVGLVGFADPLRDEVPQALRECRDAGVRVVMITGDYPQTAQAIAMTAGFEQGECLTGQELEALEDDELARRARRITVFARITPSQKLRIVNAFKANGEVVAMTGDGVNDAAALKAAHIGIAMGGRGTDVAREAASLVLLDDDFGSIVRAIHLGRRIYDNLRKAMSYILAIHVPIAGLALLPLLVGAPLMLTPLLIALLELIIDPTCSIVIEAEHAEPDVMQRPPRRRRESIISTALVWWSVVQGGLALLMVAAVYFHARGRDLPEGAVRLATFLSLAGASFALLLANRGRAASLESAVGRGNPVLPRVAAATVAILALLALWPAGRRFFGIVLLDAVELATCLAGAALLLIVLQGCKALRARMTAV